MNSAFHYIALLLFLGLPPILLGIRLFRSRIMPWWAFILMVAILGWGLVNVVAHFHYAHLEDVIGGYGDNPPQQLLDAWAADGSKRVFALFFGWLYGLVYSIPFLCFYAMIARLIKESPSSETA